RFGPDEGLYTLRVVNARHLKQDLARGRRTLILDRRLLDAVSINAAFNDLLRLIDGIDLQCVLSGRTEGPCDRRARTSLVPGLKVNLLFNGLNSNIGIGTIAKRDTEIVVPVLRDGRIARNRNFRVGMVVNGRESRLGVVLGHRLEVIVELYAHHKMRTALKV